MSILSHSPRSTLHFKNELEGFTESSRTPIEHSCDWQLVHMTLNSGEIVLLCFGCGEYWHTGVLEPRACRFVSHKLLMDAAIRRYGVRDAA
jgi:hypothetical protein